MSGLECSSPLSPLNCFFSTEAQFRANSKIQKVSSAVIAVAVVVAAATLGFFAAKASLALIGIAYFWPLKTAVVISACCAAVYGLRSIIERSNGRHEEPEEERLVNRSPSPENLPPVLTSYRESVPEERPAENAAVLDDPLIPEKLPTTPVAPAKSIHAAACNSDTTFEHVFSLFLKTADENPPSEQTDPQEPVASSRVVISLFPTHEQLMDRFLAKAEAEKAEHSDSRGGSPIPGTAQ